MRSRTVLQVSQPTDQGVAIVCADYVALLVSRGWEVHVACPDEGGLAEQCASRGAAVHIWRAGREPGPQVRQEARDLRDVIESVDPSLVHLHSSKAGLAGRLTLRGRRPTIFSPHAWSFLHGGRSTRRAALGWERFAQRWTDVTVCGSIDERMTGRDAGMVGRIELIPNAVSVTAPFPSREEARAALGVSANTNLVVCLGRLVPQKGQDVLLQAWRGLSIPDDAELALVGGGSDEALLRQGAPSSVRFVGETPRDIALEWLQASDVVVAPSRWETMSLAVLEALALGRVVVASDAHGMRDAIGAGPGEVVPVDDSGALANALQPYLADRALAHTRGTEVSAEFDRRWSNQLDRNGDLLDATYRSLL